MAAARAAKWIAFTKSLLKPPFSVEVVADPRVVVPLRAAQLRPEPACLEVDFVDDGRVVDVVDGVRVVDFADSVDVVSEVAVV